jgi:hypothetical protein
MAFLQAIMNREDESFRKERDNLIKKYEKPIGYTTVANSVRNSLQTADEIGVNSLSAATMGFGIMGDLNMVESVSAMVTGVKLYQAQTAEPKEHELRIVLYAQDNPKNREAVAKQILPAIDNGKFLETAELLMAGQQIDFAALHADYLKNDAPTQTVKRASRMQSIMDSCLRLLRMR